MQRGTEQRIDEGQRLLASATPVRRGASAADSSQGGCRVASTNGLAQAASPIPCGPPRDALLARRPPLCRGARLRPARRSWRRMRFPACVWPIEARPTARALDGTGRQRAGRRDTRSDRSGHRLPRRRRRLRRARLAAAASRSEACVSQLPAGCSAALPRPLPAAKRRRTQLAAAALTPGSCNARRPVLMPAADRARHDAPPAAATPVAPPNSTSAAKSPNASRCSTCPIPHRTWSTVRPPLLHLPHPSDPRHPASVRLIGCPPPRPRRSRLNDNALVGTIPSELASLTILFDL